MPGLKKAWKSVTFKSLRMPKHENIVSKPADAGSMRYMAYGYLFNRTHIKTMYRNCYAHPLRDRMVMGEAYYRSVYMDLSRSWWYMHSYEGGGSVPFASMHNTFLGEQYYMHNVEDAQRSLRCLFSISDAVLQRILDHPQFDTVFRMLPGDPERTSAMLSMVHECGSGVDSFNNLKVYALLLFFNGVVDSFNVDIRVTPHVFRFPNETFVRTLVHFAKENPDFILETNIILDAVEDQCVVKLSHRLLRRFIKDEAFRSFMNQHARRFMAGI
jgi:hypothetical protein